MARRRKKNPFKWMLFSLAFIVVVAIIYLLFTFDQQKTDSRGCISSHASSAFGLYILLDATEPYGSSQLENISRFILSRVKELEPHDNVRVYTIKPNTSLALKPVFDFCKPNPQSHDSPIAVNFEERRFRFFLERALKDSQGVQPISPIIWSIGSVASQFSDSYRGKEIILVSDLIEHSQALSMYRSDWVSAAGKSGVDKSRPMLRDVDVQILWLLRAQEDRQSTEMRDWWVTYLEESEAYIKGVKPISGS